MTDCCCPNFGVQPNITQTSSEHHRHRLMSDSIFNNDHLVKGFHGLQVFLAGEAAKDQQPQGNPWYLRDTTNWKPKRFRIFRMCGTWNEYCRMSIEAVWNVWILGLQKLLNRLACICAECEWPPTDTHPADASVGKIHLEILGGDRAVVRLSIPFKIVKCDLMGITSNIFFQYLKPRIPIQKKCGSNMVANHVIGTQKSPTWSTTRSHGHGCRRQISESVEFGECLASWNSGRIRQALFWGVLWSCAW